MAVEGDRAEDEAAPVEGALSELIVVEERIEAEVAMAEAEASRLVDSAQQEAQRLDRDSDDAFEDALRALRASLDAESAVSIRALMQDAEVEIQRYQRVDEVTVRRLAQWVADRVVGGGGAA
jgi:vacuolar-type H+-ATPase subunit H